MFSIIEDQPKYYFYGKFVNNLKETLFNVKELTRRASKSGRFGRSERRNLYQPTNIAAEKNGSK